MRKIICAALIAGSLAAPACLFSDKVAASPVPLAELTKVTTVSMPNCVGEQYQDARDGLPVYFKQYGVTATVYINFVENTDPGKAFTVKDQNIPADAQINANSSISITLDVYSGMPGQPLPLEKDECAMPLCIGEQFQDARDGLPLYFKQYGVTATVYINFVENTDPSKAFTVKDQNIPADAGVKVNKPISITLDVYSGMPGQPLPLEKDECAMPLCIGEQYQDARDGLPLYFKQYGVTATVYINFVENTDPSKAFTVKDQDIPADAGVKVNKPISITLDVYSGMPGQPLPLEKDECAMPLCIGEQYQDARDGLPLYFKQYGVTATVYINFVENTDPSKAFTVKDQNIPADAGVKVNKPISITLDVYSGMPGQPLPLEKDECAMPLCIGESYKEASDGLVEYFKGYGVTATVNINFVENTEPSKSFTVKDQSIPADAGVKVNKPTTITLDVYDGVGGQPDPNVTTTPAPSNSNSNEQISNFVDRLYSSVLGRDADPDGAKFWNEKLTSYELTGAEVAEKFVLSPEFLGSVDDDTQFVTVLYKAFFDREPDAEGLAYWTNALSNKTMTREQVEQNFVFSKEWADTCASYGILSGSDVKPSTKIEPTEATLAFVERMYTKAMNRESDPEGKAFWADKLANYNCTGEQIALEFFTSKEMKEYNLSDEEYVIRLYNTFMDREPDADGLAFWKNELANGADRAEVVKGFAKSAEFNQKCIDARILPC